MRQAVIPDTLLDGEASVTEEELFACISAAFYPREPKVGPRVFVMHAFALNERRDPRLSDGVDWRSKHFPRVIFTRINPC